MTAVPYFYIMAKRITLAYLCSVLALPLWAQSIQNDSIQELQEIILISNTKNNTPNNPIASIENYLKQAKSIDMIQRGNYAWEPTLNNMATERISLTIDGMHIFNACTDKMDPITSYVETYNLQQASIQSGQQGNHYGPTLGGSIDLQTRRPYFTTSPQWEGNLNLGYETNNQLKTAGTILQYSSPKWYFQAQTTLRDAGNYKAGNRKEILYSQYTKTNASGVLGYSISPNKTLETQVIYDKATDVGYPALPMDVSLAEALITSIRYEVKPSLSFIDNWETKLYYNTITHRMDDTKRPPETIAIHMDMPGWSNTYGLYSSIKSTQKNHHLSGTINSYYNRSLAEMTMYPNNPNEKKMFMYTWPDVHTQYIGMSLQDHWKIDKEKSLLVSASMGMHSNQIKNQMALESLQIFYPKMNPLNTRTLGSFAINYEIKKLSWNYGVGVAIGNRAPSVSEGYGFYLFNSSEQFDYIGNPNLKNEVSSEINTFLTYTSPALISRLSGSLFHIQHYIIGNIIPELSAMTIGAKGVKQYNNLAYARLATLNWSSTYKFNNQWLMNIFINYNYGEDNDRNSLPFISPISYGSSLTYSKNKLETTLELQANSSKNNNAIAYGEKETSSYAIVNWNANYSWNIHENIFTLHCGISNIFDKYYTAYSDWNAIPRVGRNFSISLQYSW